MSIHDLSVWFRRSYATVHSWTNQQRNPKDGRRAQVYRDLELLERCIAKRKGLPIPEHVELKERAGYVGKLYAKYARISESASPTAP